jgi:hypothetical protein
MTEGSPSQNESVSQRGTGGVWNRRLSVLFSGGQLYPEKVQREGVSSDKTIRICDV